MLIDVVMPMFDEVMEEGTVIEWKKSEGDQIQKGETLLLVETDKATMEVEATHAGVLVGPLAADGDTVPCNQVIGKIEAPALPGVAS